MPSPYAWGAANWTYPTASTISIPYYTNGITQTTSSTGYYTMLATDTGERWIRQGWAGAGAAQLQAQQAMLQQIMYADQYDEVHRNQARLQAEAEKREKEDYAKAVAEHNEQEAARLKRVIDAREAARIQAERQRQELVELTRIRNEQRQLATARAKDFLIEHLSPEQRKTFEKNHWFIVEGGKTKKTYRIQARGNFVGNIDVLNDKGERQHGLCAHCDTDVIPTYDNLLAQKMMLQYDEERFLAIANVHR